MAADPAVATPAGELDRQWVREDVACALRLSSGHAADRLAQASALGRLPAPLDLLDLGKTTPSSPLPGGAVMSRDDTAAAAVANTELTRAPAAVAEQPSALPSRGPS